MAISYTPHYQPSLEDDPSLEIKGLMTGLRPLRESSRNFELDDIAFDDTHKLLQVDRDRKILREAETFMEDNVQSYGPKYYGHGSSAPSSPERKSPAHFQRGVPTNDRTSSQNYNPDHTRIIKGEHVSLLKNGALNEALDNDNHDNHILEHRYMLANENLTETMRSALLEHIAQHIKMKKKGMKQVQEDLGERAKRRFGPAVVSRNAVRHNADVDDKIPQWSPVDKERLKTQGIMSMESGGSRRQGKTDRFQSALKIRRGL